MPIRRGTDKFGPYYAWGKNGHHYHYLVGDKDAREAAKWAAGRQGKAIKASQGKYKRK